MYATPLPSNVHMLNTAQQKLQPFFPPLEPLQSLNLRAALYRSLNELKKNGLLGRETILRKTMLDECKGEKLIEVLAIFSSAVVRRIELSRTRSRIDAPISSTLATATILDAVQQGSLIPLSMAYSASLATALRKREDKKARFAQFRELLDVKASQLKDRLETCSQSKEPTIDAAEEEQIKKVLHDNWPGSSKWPQTVLYGDEVNAGDLPLQRPFSEVWNVVAEGGQFPSELHNIGLLENLERRINEQSSRLRKWHDFHNKFFASNGGSSSAADKISQGGMAFKFGRHRNLRIGTSISPSYGNPPVPALAQKYQDILTGVKRDLFTATKCRRVTANGVLQPVAEHSIFSPVKGSNTQARPILDNGSILDNKPLLANPNTKIILQPLGPEIKIAPPIEQAAALAPISQAAEAISPPIPKAPSVIPPPKSSNETESIPSEESSRASTPESSSEEENAADLIINSVMNGTPSPVKASGYTLAERTRMSMANMVKPHTKKFVEPPPPPPPEPPVRGIEIHNRRETLLERTRQSMSHVPATNGVKSKKLPRKSNRQSLFPVNQFETPGKPKQPPPEIKRDATPTEKLFSEDAEYNSVFKSRPKIALSPVWSLGEGSPSVPTMDEESDDDVPGEVWESSPLARRGIAG
jgi:hypothetical protein